MAQDYESYDENEDPDKDIFGLNSTNVTVAGLVLTVLTAASAVGIISCAKETHQSKIRQPVYEQLTSKVEVVAQKGDNLSNLMMKHAGCYPQGSALYQWQLDNKKYPSKEISFGEKYIFRTTNTSSRTSN